MGYTSWLYQGEFLDPFLAELLQPVVDSRFESLQNNVIGTLDLAVGSRVSYCRPVDMDVMPVTEVQELFPGELRAIVGDDDTGNPKPMNYVSEEEYNLLGVNVCDGSSLDPFGELIDGHQQVVYPPAALWRGPMRSRPHTANGQVMGIICSA
jgi:hypothetical protein